MSLNDVTHATSEGEGGDRCKAVYRVSHLLANMGWVDTDLRSSLGWWAANAANYCPSRMVGHLKYESTQPRFSRRLDTQFII